MSMITTVRNRTSLLAITARTRLAALAEEPELGGGRNTDEGFHIGIGALAAGAISVAVVAFIANKMGALS
jgi:hypothetical protein